MAYVSSKYTAGSTGMGTSTNQAQPALWSYAVPSDEDPATSTNTESAVDHSTFSSTHQSLTTHVNGTSRPKARWNDRAAASPDTTYTSSASLRPPAPIAEPSDISGNNSEADSLLDLYRTNGDRSKSSARDPVRVKRKGSLGAVSALSDSNPGQDMENKWIHRDKLAQIESRELAELKLSSRGGSRSRTRFASKKSSVAPTDDIEADAIADGDLPQPDSKRMRTISPTHPNDDLPDDDPAGAAAYSPATPNQSTPRTVQPGHARRPSASKIPVTKSSPQVEPSSPTLPPSPHQRMIRARSASQSNQNSANPPPISTDIPNASPMVSSPDSAQKKNLPSKTTPQSGQRKASRGGKATGGTSSRPGTSGGTSRPSTARPEGEPPWIATMYKPDPMLPPDQQILPTHARRMAQEQEFQGAIERGEYYEPPENSEYMLLDDQANDADPDSHPGVDYSNQVDRDVDYTNQIDQSQPRQSDNQPVGRGQDQQYDAMHAVAYNPPNGYQAAPPSPTDFHPHRQASHGQYQSQTSPSRNKIPHDDLQWPLRSPGPDASPKKLQQDFHHEKEVYIQPNGRSGTPVLDSGYSLIPQVQSQKEKEQPAAQRFRHMSPAPAPGTQRTAQAIRVPEAPKTDEKEGKKKKGCGGCCIVM